MMTTTKAAIIQPGGGIESLTWVDRPVPSPRAKEVLVRVQAASLNYRDLMIARGLYPLAHSHPVVALSDCSGVVETVGSAVTSFSTGDRVTANFMRDWVSGPLTDSAKSSSLGGEVDGVLSEYVVLPEHALAKLPDRMTFTAAATYACAGVTAWNAVVSRGRVQPGDTVLVQGSGGVSVFALQIATLAGATVIATSGSDEKLERLKDLGASFTINYKTTEDWASAALAYTGGKGVDHVVEVGGAQTFAQSLRATRMSGTVSVIGVLSGVETSTSLVPFLHKQLTVNGIFVGSRLQLEESLRMRVSPVIDRVFPFFAAQQAMRYLESGKHVGKVVLRRDEE